MVNRYRVLRRSGDSVRADWKHVSVSAEPGVWLRVLRAGICGTDLQILRGVRDDRAEILGHEGVVALMGSQQAGGPPREASRRLAGSDGRAGTPSSTR